MPNTDCPDIKFECGYKDSPQSCISNTNSCFDTKHFLPSTCQTPESDSYINVNGKEVKYIDNFCSFLNKTQKQSSYLIDIKYEDIYDDKFPFENTIPPTAPTTAAPTTENFEMRECKIDFGDNHRCLNKQVPSQIHHCGSSKLSNKTRMWNDLCGQCIN